MHQMFLNISSKLVDGTVLSLVQFLGNTFKVLELWCKIYPALLKQKVGLMALNLAVCCPWTELSFITSDYIPSVAFHSISLCHFVSSVFTVRRESLQAGCFLKCDIYKCKMTACCLTRATRLNINILTILVRLLQSVCLLFVYSCHLDFGYVYMPSTYRWRITSRCTLTGFRTCS